MANWIGTARTNYFRVRDALEFREWAAQFEMVIFTDDAGRFGLYTASDNGGFPYMRKNGDEDEVLDVADELSKLLADGSIAVLMEIGHVKNSYVSGFALAVNSLGKQVSVMLSDICGIAAAGFGVDPNTISEARN